MNDLIVGTVAVFTGLTIIFAVLIINMEQRLRCIEAVKDKPAAEIVVVCK